MKRPARTDAYFDRIDALLDDDPAARTAIPNLPAMMRRVHARLEADPVTLRVRRASGPLELRVGGFGVQLLTGSLIANPETLALVPGLYHALDAGKVEALTPFMGQVATVLGVNGMGDAMDLASGISPGRLALVEREAKTAVLGDALNFPMPHLVGAIPGVDLGDDYRRPIRIPHPSLLVAGSLDGRTVLDEQAEVAAQFRNRSQVLVENSGHNVFESHPSVQDLIVRFFRGERVPDTKLALSPPKFHVA